MSLLTGACHHPTDTSREGHMDELELKKHEVPRRLSTKKTWFCSSIGDAAQTLCVSLRGWDFCSYNNDSAEAHSRRQGRVYCREMEQEACWCQESFDHVNLNVKYSRIPHRSRSLDRNHSFSQLMPSLFFFN